MKKIIISLLNKAPYIRGLFNELNGLKKELRFPIGHYHNPIPNSNEIEEHYSKINNKIQDINFNFENQINQLETYKIFYNEMPWDFYDDSKNVSFRYKNKDSYYRYSDAIFLYLNLRKYQPKKIIEVGSGFSSAIMIDTYENCMQNIQVNFCFIEPNPDDRLNKLLTNKDKQSFKIVKEKVQNVDKNIFKTLEENDILFIDSSHITKTGSDLNFIIFEILPKLNKGVLIHFHDIFYPFEYPKDWITTEKFFWNECYILRAFLMNNNDYEIIFFNSAAHMYNKKYLQENFPETLIDNEHTGSIWLKKK